MTAQAVKRTLKREVTNEMVSRLWRLSIEVLEMQHDLV